MQPTFVLDLAGIATALERADRELRLIVDTIEVLQAIRTAGLSGRFKIHRYIGDVVGAVAGIDEHGRGPRRHTTAGSPIIVHPAKP